MSRSLSNILNTSVKGELNMLYTEPLHMTPTGFDFGLFCREHAYHSYLLCRAEGVPAEIKLGHYFVLNPNGLANLTLDSGADHAWCAAAGVAPIDLSMTFHLADRFVQLPNPVIGTGKNGPYMIHCLREEQEFRAYIKERPDPCCVCYLEESTVEIDEDTLLDNPFSFLLPPAVHGGSWSDVYGKDIFAKITIHLHKLSMGHVKPLFKTMDSPKAVGVIRKKYKAAIPKLKKLLKKDG
jgi:hypothetical protein